HLTSTLISSQLQPRLRNFVTFDTRHRGLPASSYGSSPGVRSPRRRRRGRIAVWTWGPRNRTVTPASPRGGPCRCLTSHPALPTQVSQSTLQVGSSTSILPTRNRDEKKDTTAEQGVRTRPDLNVAFTKTVLSSKLYPVRAIGTLSEPCEEVLEIGEEIGWGAFATVFKANWGKRTVAVKYFDGSRKMQDPSQTNMDYFRREVQVYEWLSSLQGKYIPKVYGSYERVEERFGREERFGIVVMEVLTGAFQDDIETVSLEARQKALVALKKVHEIGVLQGDIRVQNFYFGSEKEYLIDFSHSRVSEYGRELNFEEEKAKVCLGLGETTSRRNRPASTREHEMSSMSWLEPNSEPNRGLEWVETLFGFEPKWKESPEITTLTTLARRVLSLPSTSSCSVSFLAAGAFNKLYTIYHSSSESSASELSQDREQQRVLRVALPVDPKFKVLSEVATLTFLCQFSKLVPEPLEYDDGRDNEVGFEWMLMSKVEGLPIEESWRALNWEEKERVVNDVVTFLADLFNRRFEGIGSLFCDREGKKESSFKVGRIVSMIFFWHNHLQYPIPRGPFRSSHDWLDARLSIHHLDAQNIIETCKDDDEVEFARETQKRLVRLRTLLPLLFPPPSNGASEETALYHADLSWHNLLVSPTQKTLSGIVD
ncbi:hypothetical protein BT69DRAFT_1393279, partial [Atractiella rhizophila]